MRPATGLSAVSRTILSSSIEGLTTEGLKVERLPSTCSGSELAERQAEWNIEQEILNDEVWNRFALSFKK